MHVLRLLYALPVHVHSIGNKRGIRRDQVKNARLPPQNSSGALAPQVILPLGPDTSRTLAIQTEPGRVEE